MGGFYNAVKLDFFFIAERTSIFKCNVFCCNGTGSEESNKNQNFVTSDS